MTFSRGAFWSAAAFATVSAAVSAWRILRNLRLAKSRRRLFLGIDCSTQALKAFLVAAEDLKIVWSTRISFSEDLPHYGTEDGVIRDGLKVTAPTAMFVEALEMALDRMVDEMGVEEISKIQAISASGQQHGSVFWANGAREKLRQSSSEKSLVEILRDAFTIPNGPIWMDSSTAKQCEALEKELGGAQRVADITGSRAYERFTGNQISKAFLDFPDSMNSNCERISLVSSFLSSLLIGDFAPVDISDGSGMNLMDIRSGKWSADMLKAVEKIGNVKENGSLREKLGEEPVESHAFLGRINWYFMERWNFHSDCSIIASSGDNPCSLAGLGLHQPGDVGISLGTSSTLFAIVENPAPSSEEGHILRNPLDPNSFMAMLCFKNGAITRKRIRDQFCNKSWETFAEHLKGSVVGNDRNFGFYFTDAEITPVVNRCGIVRFSKDQNRVLSENETFANPYQEARAVVEWQFLSMRYHSEKLQVRARRVLLAGGASNNREIVQILADIFNAEVFQSKVGPETAAIGAAYRALHGYECCQKRKFIPFDEVVHTDLELICKPNPRNVSIYDEMMVKYGELESTAIKLVSEEKVGTIL